MFQILVEARKIVINPIPVDRIAFISLSSDSFPNVAKVASNTAIGTDSANYPNQIKD